MYRGVTLAVIALLGLLADNARRPTAPLPAQFEIARHTFFDFGPPLDYYELYLVRPAGNRTSIERLTIIPEGAKCVVPPKLEVSRGTLPLSIAELLGGENPCTIPEKALRKESRRGKHALVFSGAVVTLQAKCGDQVRLIHSDILDRDMFAAVPHTPEYTSWTMNVLAKLDGALGPGVMDKPMFPTADSENKIPVEIEPEVIQDLSAGKYDSLYPNAPNQPSAIYHQIQAPPPPPTVRLLSAEPLSPEKFVAPAYPPIAKLAHVEGVVSVQMEIDAYGTVTTLTTPLIFDDRLLPLHGVVSKAATEWKFPEGTANRQTRLKIEFALHCDERAPKP